MSECDKTDSPFKQTTVNAGGGWIRGARDVAETNRSCVHLRPWIRRETSLHADITLGAHAALTQPSSCVGPVCLSAPTGLSSVRTASRFFSYCQLHSRFLTSV